MGEDGALPARHGRVRRYLRAHPWLTDITIGAIYLTLWVADSPALLTSSPLMTVHVLILTTLVVLRRCYAEWVLAGVVVVPILTRLAMTAWQISPTMPGDTHFTVEIAGQTLHRTTLPFIDVLALMIACYTVANERRLRTSLPVVGLALAASLAAILTWAPSTDVGSWATLLTLVVSLAFLLGSNVRSSRQRMEALERRALQLALEHEQREQLAVSQERTRIAREMHDVVAHSLSVMVTLAEGAAVAQDHNPEMAKKAVTQLAQVGRDSLADARRLVGVLRQEIPDQPVPGQPDPGAGREEATRDPQPGQHDVARLVESYRRAGMPVTFTTSGPDLPPDQGLHLAIYRIVQESLTNVLRYARASRKIDVQISSSGRDVIVTIENEAGPGEQIMPGSGKGLIGMRERAAVYDGTVHAGATTTGWQVRANLQVPGQARSWSSPI